MPNFLPLTREEEMVSCLFQRHSHKVKCKQLRFGFDLGTPISLSTTITVMHRAPPNWLSIHDSFVCLHTCKLKIYLYIVYNKKNYDVFIVI